MQNKEIAKTESAPKQQSPIIYFIVTLVLLASIFLGGFWLYKSATKVDYVQANLNGQTYKLEVANTQSEREKGLSQRDSLPEDQGMLFDFEKDGDWSIWMLQMRFPLDIVWLNSDKQVIAIKQNVTAGSYPEVFRAAQEGRYVIELNAGAVKRIGLQNGDTAQW